jgi:hypothetical protein
MSSFKNNIPKSFVIAAFNQVNNYLIAMNYMPDLPEISPNDYGAEVFFGGSGDWDPEVDVPKFNLVMTTLADNLSVQAFIMKRHGMTGTFVERIKDPSEVTGSIYGYDALFEQAAPELL